jgi:hypothetical protein
VTSLRGVADLLNRWMLMGLGNHGEANCNDTHMDY